VNEHFPGKAASGDSDAVETFLRLIARVVVRRLATSDVRKEPATETTRSNANTEPAVGRVLADTTTKCRMGGEPLKPSQRH
jgi:hypothetical protein